MIEISGSSIQNSKASDLVDRFPDNGGAGGAGGNAGAGGNGQGGIGGDGGDGGNAGDGNSSGAGGAGGQGGANSNGPRQGYGSPGSNPGVSRVTRCYGGAIVLNGQAYLSLINTEFQDNQSEGDHAGAICAYYSGSTLRIEDSTFVNNRTGTGPVRADGTGAGNGGAIYAYPMVSFDVVRSSFVENSTTGNTSGGAIYYASSDFTGPLHVTDCTFTDNRTGLSSASNTHTGIGGAISIESLRSAIDRTVHTILRSAFTGNQAEYGGALAASMNLLRVEECQFSENTAEYGGAMSWWDSDVRITNSDFVGNQAVPVGTGSTNMAALGGAIYADHSGAVLTNNTFVANLAQYGGGAVYLLGPSFYVADSLGDWDIRQEFINCLFVENEAGMTGGAIKAMNGAELVLQFCTLADNLATNMYGDGGAISLGYDHFSGDGDDWTWWDSSYVLLKNSILWNNLAVFGPQVAVGDPLKVFNVPSTLELYYTNIAGHLADVFLGEPYGYPWAFDAGGVIDADPQFLQARTADPADPTTRTFYLAQEAAGQFETSPSVNTGIGNASILEDLLGFAASTRTDHEPDTDTVDMGYHYNAALPVEEYTLTASVFVGIITPSAVSRCRQTVSLSYRRPDVGIRDAQAGHTGAAGGDSAGQLSRPSLDRD